MVLQLHVSCVMHYLKPNKFDLAKFHANSLVIKFLAVVWPATFYLGLFVASRLSAEMQPKLINGESNLSIELLSYHKAVNLTVIIMQIIHHTQNIINKVSPRPHKNIEN